MISLHADLTRCLSYIDCQLKASSSPGHSPKSRRPPSVTISRQTGVGARAVADLLAEHLQRCERSNGCPPWTVFDRNLVEKVLEDHHLPKRLAQFMPEDRRSTIQDIMEELLGLHPPAWTLFHQTTETILHLAEMGHVILIGRGANVITSRLDNVFHVRLVASLPQRIARVCAQQNLTPKAAQEFIQKEDEGRERYLRKNFGQSMDDNLLYHLVINTDRFSLSEVACLIGDAILRRFPECFPGHAAGGSG